MYTRDRAGAAVAALDVLMAALVERAREHVDWPMPGYTRPAARAAGVSGTPSARVLLDARARPYALSVRAGRVLAPAARLGRPGRGGFDTDRRMLARELGFAEVAPDSIDAVSGRDFVFDYLNAAATCATHLSRLGAELVLWSSTEFGFCELPGRLELGQPIMPQKKIPTRPSCCAQRRRAWSGIWARCTA